MSEIKKVKSWKIFLPVVIGLLVIVFMFVNEFKPSAFDEISITWISVACFALAFICIFMRDLGYVVRLRVLSDNKLSWRQAFRIIMLWEFTSTVTPGALGGTSVALMYVHKEGISLGKSSSIVMLTSLLDELYFIIIFPLMLLILGSSKLFFSVEDSSLDLENLSGWSYGLFWLTMIAYSIKFVWVLFLVYGLFVNPKNFSRMIYRIFKLPFLRRWKRNIVRVIRDIENNSAELKTKKISFWAKALASTFVSWTGRYLVVNCLFMAFFAVHEHLIIYARQLVMIIVLLICPTPGGSGFAEIMFNEYLGEYVDMAGLTGFSIVLALLWRLVTFYPYLIIGTVMMPKWISDNFVGKAAPMKKPKSKK